MSEPQRESFTAEDLAYIRQGFVTLAAACAGAGRDPAHVRRLIENRRLPRASYVLPDGTEMVPPDYFLLLEDAGSVDAMPERFAQRYGAAASAHGRSVPSDEVEREWRNYVRGDYGVCLRHATPENIFRKGWLIEGIEELLERPRPSSSRWRRELGARVEALEGLEREFSPHYDRARWGSVSRDRLIVAVRERYGVPASDSG